MWLVIIVCISLLLKLNISPQTYFSRTFSSTQFHFNFHVPHLTTANLFSLSSFSFSFGKVCKANSTNNLSILRQVLVFDFPRYCDDRSHLTRFRVLDLFLVHWERLTAVKRKPHIIASRKSNFAFIWNSAKRTTCQHTWWDKKACNQGFQPQRLNARQRHYKLCCCYLVRVHVSEWWLLCVFHRFFKLHRGLHSNETIDLIAHEETKRRAIKGLNREDWTWGSVITNFAAVIGAYACEWWLLCAFHCCWSSIFHLTLAFQEHFHQLNFISVSMSHI